MITVVDQVVMVGHFNRGVMFEVLRVVGVDDVKVQSAYYIDIDNVHNDMFDGFPYEQQQEAYCIMTIDHMRWPRLLVTLHSNRAQYISICEERWPHHRVDPTELITLIIDYHQRDDDSEL